LLERLYSGHQGLVVGGVDLGVGGALRNLRRIDAEALAQGGYAIVLHPQLQ
jgi:hypothetical protein